MPTTRGYYQNSKKVFRVEIKIKCKQTLSKRFYKRLEATEQAKQQEAKIKEYSIVTVNADPQIIRMFIDVFQEEFRPKWGVIESSKLRELMRMV